MGRLAGWNIQGTGQGLWKYIEVGWPPGQTPAEQLKKAEAFFRRCREEGVMDRNEPLSFEAFRDEGLLCFLNTHFFHPNGFALAFVYEEEEESNEVDAPSAGRDREAR